MRSSRWSLRIIGLLAVSLVATLAQAQAPEIRKGKPDPYGSPRPAPGQLNVPLRTSYFIEVAPGTKNAADRILSDTLTVSLETHGAAPVEVLHADGTFAPGYSGVVVASSGWNDNSGIFRMNIESDHELPAATTCTVRVTAKSATGRELAPKKGSWWFVTEGKPSSETLSCSLDFASSPITWHGGFWTGICWGGVIPEMAEGYQKIADVRKKFPKSWNLHRTSTLAGFEYQPGFGPARLPNIVRELETRRIKAMEPEAQGVRLRIEDFLGHEQYGIPSNRPVSADYHKGDEVLVADGVSSTRTLVVSADDATRSVLVQSFGTPSVGWKIEYGQDAPTPKQVGIPGVFPSGGCYLRKFNPVGTPHYYWKRMDQEWDHMWKRYGRRPIAGFDQAPGDLSIDGGPYNTAKDYAQLHEVVRTITSHAIDRYGKDCLEFYWSIFNEPDLFTMYWRSKDWFELQKYYDYATDAILRAFEDHGMDSSKVVVGGLELGGIFGKNLRAWEFLMHCSPTTTPLKNSTVERVCRPGMLPYNAAYADKRLDGKRSKRVETLCAANNGRGAPCDFLSVHVYNGATMAAEKLIRGKEMALDVNPEYFRNLFVNTHEACPSWAPPPDEAASDSYMGNGYFETWCADVTHRRLERSIADPRYAFGESILTFWGSPGGAFRGNNSAVHSMPVDTNGDGVTDRHDIVLMPIVNYLALMCSIGPDLWVMPSQTRNGHRIGGFASRNEKETRVLLYDHNEGDPQSRSSASITCALDLRATGWKKARIQEYRFDKQHNSFFEAAKVLGKKPPATVTLAKTDSTKLLALARDIKAGKNVSQSKAVAEINKLGPQDSDAIPLLMDLTKAAKDEKIKGAAWQTVFRLYKREVAYTPGELKPVYDAQKLQVTSSRDIAAEADGAFSTNLTLSSNGSVFLVIEPR